MRELQQSCASQILVYTHPAMLIIDLTDSKGKAFQKGFWKGLGAPLMLFNNFEAPPLPSILPIEVSFTSTKSALRHDWAMIGCDIQAAAGKYGEKQKIAK